MSDAGEVEPQDRDYEAEAYAQGWRPREQFLGDPEKWIDARTFMDRGEGQLPLLRSDNRKLRGQNRDILNENVAIKRQLEEMNTSLASLRTMAERSNEAGYQRALADLKAQQRQAVRDGDEAKFDHIETEIAKVEATREEIMPVTEVAPKPVENKGPKAAPEFQAWFADNKEWVNADPVLGKAAVAAELELRNSDEDYTDAEIWDKVTPMVQAKYPRRFAAATGNAEPVAPSPVSTQRRAAAVLAPSGGASSAQPKKSGIDGIQDADERKVARAAFNSIKRGIPDYTEKEYMDVYTNSNADTIAPAIKRKVGNGAARPN